MIEEVKYLIQELSNQSEHNQIVLNYKNHISKILKDEYFPDVHEKIVFKSLKDWSVSGYSVGEMLEFLHRYGENIKTIGFTSYDDKVQPLINIYESNLYSSIGEYTCVLIVGKSIKRRDLYGKVSSSNSWYSDRLYPDRFLR